MKTRKKRTGKDKVFTPYEWIWMEGSFVKLLQAFSQSNEDKIEQIADNKEEAGGGCDDEFDDKNMAKTTKKMKAIASFLMSPSACRTRKNRKAPGIKELQTQIC